MCSRCRLFRDASVSGREYVLKFLQLRNSLFTAFATLGLCRDCLLPRASVCVCCVTLQKTMTIVAEVFKYLRVSCLVTGVFLFFDVDALNSRRIPL